MDEHTKHPDPHPHPPAGPGHETTDVNIWAVGKFGIALVVITVLSIVMLIGLFRFFNSREPEAAGVDPVRMFPKPQLEQSEPKDLQVFREEEQKLVDGYAWVDAQKGIVRIPIDQAVDLLAKKGLPVRASSPAQGSTVSMPTESGPGVVEK